MWAVLCLTWLVVMVLGAFGAGEVARRDAEKELARQAEAAAALHAAVLRSELEKHRSLPLALAGDPDVASLLQEPAPISDRVNRKLEGLAEQTRAAAIYVIGANGITRAASNWNLPTSFVGADYGFRPYFVNAMRNGRAEFFALGTVSGRPGLYLARRVDGAEGPLGVVVVKVEFDALEAEWRASGEPAYVVDPGGVVLITSVADWRFRTTEPLDERRRRLTLIDQTLRPEALRPLPFATPAGDRPRLLETALDEKSEPQGWMHAQSGTATPGWTLHLLTPTRGAISAAVGSARALAALIVTLIAGLAAVLLRRRQQALARARAEEEARLELERRIDARTAELRTANAALNRQIEERRRAETARELLRDELVQASKLAALGQIVASVAHEINQPVAAIQTQAETAEVLLDRDQGDRVRAALRRIGEMTQRIGAITQELRIFSRKSDPKIDVIALEDAIHGALLLTRGRLDEGAIVLERQGDPTVKVRADRFRLEQVIVNLIKNAAEAMVDTPTPRLVVAVAREGPIVRLTVADNGPGLTAQVREQLFTPFVTTRANGLGLGLVICRDIVASFGGELDLIDSAQGASFVATLRAA